MTLRVPAPQALDGLLHPTYQKLPVVRQVSLERKGVGLVRPIVDGRDIQQGQETLPFIQSLRRTKTPELPGPDPARQPGPLEQHQGHHRQLEGLRPVQQARRLGDMLLREGASSQTQHTGSAPYHPRHDSDVVGTGRDSFRSPFLFCCTVWLPAFSIQRP